VPPPSIAADATAARRLRAETEGEVLFDAGSRGRYATDASIYQIMPRGVFVPRTDRDVGIAIDIARDLGIPVLARGGGSSQCGQTTGESLVVDTTKHLRRILDIDVAGRTATVQPGLVLDALNARLKADGLWFPVDVSTSAQATIGGMAGNNSCGSRSLAWGNMVHNVLGIEAWLADGSIERFGPVDRLAGRAAAIGAAVRDLALQHGDEIDARWPTVLRRVGGYNLDVFRNRSERPYTPDGSVNLAHLLVGSEGTLAFSRSLTLKLAELPRAKVLGVVNFPTFRGAMEAARHLVALGPTAVELVDRTMVDLALANPAFASTMRAAVVGDPQALLLVEFCGDAKAELEPRLDRLVECVGDLRSGASVVRMPGDAAQKALWEVRKAGLNIMMSLKGDGKPVSFIEDCAVPLEHLADYTDALTEVFARHGTRGTWYAHASVGTLHVRPILDMRTDGAVRMRAIAEEASALVRRYKGAFSGEHGDGLCRGEWIAWQFGPKLVEAFRAIKRTFDPDGLFAPNRIVDPPRMDEGALFRFPPATAPQPYRRIAIAPALDWSGWNVSADPVTEATTAPGTGGDTTGGFAKAVEMCNNNGHCRKFDAGTMCPSFRVTRNERDTTRGRANTLRLALSNQLGPDGITGEDVVRDARPLRLLQGLPARVPDRRRHGEDEDRVPRRLQDQARVHGEGPAGRPAARLRLGAEPPAGARQPARRRAGGRTRRRALARPCGIAAAAALAARHLLAQRRAARPARGMPRRRSPRRAPGARPRSSSSTRGTARSRPRTRSPPCVSCTVPATPCTCPSGAVDGSSVAAAPSSPRAWCRRQRPRCATSSRPCTRSRRPASPSSASSPRACSRCATRRSCSAWAPRQRPSRGRRCCSRSFSRAKHGTAASSFASRRPPRGCCCTDTATRRPSMPWRRSSTC
jgi:FAD/FMN-containing dehydrogenase